MKVVNITREKFDAFRKAKNMPMMKSTDFKTIAEMAKKVSGVDLSKDECFEIYRNYPQYNQKYTKV